MPLRSGIRHHLGISATLTTSQGHLAEMPAVVVTLVLAKMTLALTMMTLLLAMALIWLVVTH